MRERASLVGVLLPVILISAALGQHAVTTVAGGGPNGGKSTQASIGHPAGITSDGAGNVYVVDSTRGRVYRATPNGAITVIAGSGARGPSANGLPAGDGGPAVDAALINPMGVAVDGQGNVFVAENGNRAIRRVDAKTGLITSLVIAYGNQSIFVDSSGNVFFATEYSCGIDEWVAASGQIVTVAGLNYSRGCGYAGDGGPATSAEINDPNGIYVDSAGNLFIADTGNNVIREVDAKTGKIATIAGNGQPGYSGDAGAAIKATLNQPLGVWLDAAGNLFIADTGNNVIRKVTAGKIATVAGNGKAGESGDGGLAVNARLAAPSGVTVDSHGNLFIADANNNLIREVVAATKVIQAYGGNGRPSYAGDGGAALNAQFDDPAGVFIDSTRNIYIADASNNAVREVVAATGKVAAVAGTGKEGYAGDGAAATLAQLARPNAVFVDALGNIFIADAGNNAVREVQAATGTILTVAGNGSWGFSGDGGPATSAQLNYPSGLFVDRTGNLFIADANNNAIREVALSTGQIKTVVGNGQWGYSGDNGPATNARLKSPCGIYQDSSGNLFIADSGNNVIREVAASTGKIATVAGNGSAGYSGDNGPATSAKLNGPCGIYVDGGGNLFIGDTNNHAIREVTAKTQTITTVAGTGKPGYLDSDTPTSAQFDLPMGLAGNKAGDLLVADSENLRIRKIAAIQGTDPTPPAPLPTFSPGAGVYPKAQTVTLGDAVSGAAIYFTTNGTPPTTNSTKYKTSIPVTAGTTISAIAVASGYTQSPVAQASYTITATAPAPTFTPAAGTYVGAQQVTLADAIGTATIHYTTNGAAPTAASPIYKNPIPVSASTTIKAIAIASGFTTSPVGSAAYLIQTQVATPALSPLPRGYWTPQFVYLTDATTGATIYYTVDGSTPTSKSNPYLGGGVPIAKTTTLKAIAVATGDLTSAVASGLYTINDPSLVEQRVMAEEGMGVQLATQTFLSQISLAFNILGPTIGLDSDMGNGNCGDPNYAMFTLTQFGHAGGMVPWSPTSPTTPGYGLITYDTKCAQPWMMDELSNWTADLEFLTSGLRISAATDEFASFYGLNGVPIGAMRLTEAAELILSEGSGSISEGASAYGLGTFTPANGGPTAQLGLTCSIDLLEFLGEGEPVPCNGAIAQDFPKLNLSLGFVTPLSFSPVVTPGITWAGSQWVAVSGNGGIYTSSDGAAWTTHPTGITRNLKAVASSGSMLVAVGSGGTILTSTNCGSTWKAQSSGAKSTLTAVIWSGTQFAAVGMGGTIVTSPNGTAWTVRASGTVWPLQGVTWSGSLFVAVGISGTVVTSGDGITWTLQASGIDDSLQSVAWSGTQFVAVADAGFIATSPDGKHWSSYLSSTYNQLMGVAWSAQKKMFVAVGWGGIILTSPSGNQGTWTTQTSGTQYNLKAVSWSGQQFVAIGTGNVVLTSPDGIAWKVQPGAPEYGVVVHFTGGPASAFSGPLGGLQMSAPTIATLAISGGTPYGGATFAGYYGDLTIFAPTPTGWTATDSAHGQKFQVTLGDNTKRILAGSITSTGTGKTLATFSLDQSGSGTITYSDGSKAAITDWLPAD
ncbi:MAG: chitobiase/beta-hexosaminidase C-terminal domain-containing protein [Terracidiphilus sp.]